MSSSCTIKTLVYCLIKSYEGDMVVKRSLSQHKNGLWQSPLHGCSDSYRESDENALIRLGKDIGLDISAKNLIFLVTYASDSTSVNLFLYPMTYNAQIKMLEGEEILITPINTLSDHACRKTSEYSPLFIDLLNIYIDCEECYAI